MLKLKRADGRGSRRRFLSGAMSFLTVAGLLSACRSTSQVEVEPAGATQALRGPAPVHVSPDSWVLSTEEWGALYRGTYLGNGYVGQRFGRTGTGLHDGETQPSFMAGYYRDENLVSLPPLLPLEIRCGDRVFGADAGHARKFRQELRLREGTLLTEATWDTGSGEATLRLETVLLRAQPDVALVRARIENRGRAAISTGIPASLAQNGTNSGNRLVRTEGDVTYTSALRSLGGELPTVSGMAVGYEVAPGTTAELVLATHVQGGPVRLSNALPELPEPDATQVERWLEAHRQAWARLWESDIEIEGDAEAQQVVRASLFYILCSLRDDSDAGVAPMGLSGGAFNGHVFWDMDSWVVPALLPQYPDLVRAMLEYRYRTLSGARENAKAEGLPGASYAWESAASGRETVQGEFRHGRHVSGDVALALKQYFQATGDRKWLAERAWPILQATADNWVSRAKPDGKGGLVVRGVTTPDELAQRVDHSAWTHHVARVNLEFAAETARLLGRKADPRWEQTARKLSFLRDEQTGLILPYAGFTEKSKAKQADVLLLVHPGELQLPAEQLGKMYDYYAPRVISNGPAMTDAIHTVVAARLDRADEAMRRFRESYRPFVRPPFHLFSEKRSRDALCFLTGSAGVVEGVLYGFAGLYPEADPKTPDRPRVEPRVPPEWQAIRVRNLRWRGKAWDLELRPGAEPVWTPRNTLLQAGASDAR